eukprot:TRINITY_DN6699_c0_g1_i1.p2 TRINITY_DN6699_c0_g1~~TRINITY_DN6699_c0_g1_i1.p2  ORF type:complete len:287 (-),score=77.73 TRINITY_DN6699_c0_g1_i1:20-880(-)
MESVEKLHKFKEENGDVEWEKDDEDHLDFVTSAANIRCNIFHIESTSRFDVKSKAGNIIPAIASTNAIVAGLMVLEIYKVLNGKIDECISSYLGKTPCRNRLLRVERVEPPNPDCFVCGTNWITLHVNTKTTTLKYFVEEIAVKELNFKAPTICVGDNIIYEGDDEDFADEWEKQLQKTLENVQIVHNSVIQLEDLYAEFNLSLAVLHTEEFEGETLYEIKGKIKEQKPEVNEETNGDQMDEESESDDLLIVEEVIESISNKRQNQEYIENPEDKRQKVEEAILIE